MLRATLVVDATVLVVLATVVVEAAMDDVSVPAYT